jgi:negative regulator of sigma E activity
MKDRFNDLLSDYLDHDLPRGEAEALERHLVDCAECRDTLAALERVKARAATLVDPPAPNDLWAGIAPRIGTAGTTSVKPRPIVVHELPDPRSARAHRPAVWSVPQWALAAAAVVAVAVGVSWLVQTRLTPGLRPEVAVQQATPDRAQTSAANTASDASFDATAIESQIGQLQHALDLGRDKLDPKTVQVLEDNLRIIRKATEDARRALEQDPANRELRNYFAGSVQSKLDMVRRATELAGV